jgi:TonB family protein
LGTGRDAFPDLAEEILMTGSSNKKGIIARFYKSDTQPSLFHYVKEKPDPGVFEDMDWSFLRHPIRTAIQAWKAPRTKPSLFHYIEQEPKTPFNCKEFLSDVFTGFRNPAFIPSFFSDPNELALERAQGRTRKYEAGLLSILAHAAVVLIAFFLVRQANTAVPKNDDFVFVKSDLISPFEGDGRDGGGGGGGGKNQPLPPATGRMPDTTRVQLVPPDPENPRPLMPAEDLLAQAPSVQMPIDIPQDQSLPIGDITAPPNNSMSSGPGSGGGIGTGRGTGVGSGKGAGVGPGEGGGMGGGRGGGIGSGVGPYVVGNGVKAPEALYQPLPAYTEEARKARAEGIVLIQAVIRKDGTVDSFKVLRGLGYGLDESAINTIATKWRFKAGTLRGEPVDVQANIEVSFRLY